MSRRLVLSFVAGLVVAATALTSPGGPAVAGGVSAGGDPGPLPASALHALYDVGVRPGPGAAKSDATAATGLRTWTRTVTDGGSRFTHRMVGRDPFVPQVNASTTVTVPLVPLVVTFSNGLVFDPTVGSSCDTTSAVSRTLASPIVKPVTWSFGGTSVGKGQYADAFARASFFTQTQPTGINPGYHVKLKYVLQPAVTVAVPSGKWAYFTTTCGNNRLGVVDVDWVDSWLRTNALPALASAGYGPSTFPLFLTSNVVEYIGTPSTCCVLGFHNATGPAPGGTTYSLSTYETSGAFGPTVSDVSVLSHEVSEWVADPYLDNLTRPWGHTGQVGGCQSNLEVGDPLTGTVFPVSAGGRSWTMQEMAFPSWFTHEAPNPAVNGWYSNRGTFTTPAAACT